VLLGCILWEHVLCIPDAFLIAFHAFRSALVSRWSSGRLGVALCVFTFVFGNFFSFFFNFFFFRFGWVLCFAIIMNLPLRQKKTKYLALKGKVFHKKEQIEKLPIQRLQVNEMSNFITDCEQ
jgi:hypothetical protein